MLISELIRVEVTPDIALKIRQLAEEGVFTLTKGNVVINIDNGEFLTLKVERISHPKKLSTVSDIASNIAHDNMVK